MLLCVSITGQECLLTYGSSYAQDFAETGTADIRLNCDPHGKDKKAYKVTKAATAEVKCQAEKKRKRTPQEKEIRKKAAVPSEQAKSLHDLVHDENALATALSRMMRTKETRQDAPEQGWSMDDRDREGRTALYCAARDNLPKALKRLINNGASIYIADHFDATPLYIAATKKNEEGVKLLIAAAGLANQCER